MLEALIAEIFDRRRHRWSVDGKPTKVGERDIMAALDHAAAILHAEEPGTRLEVGGLIIDKTEIGHDVYVFVGDYQ